MPPIAEALPDPSPDPSIAQFVERSGLLPLGCARAFRPLAGGVSSDIWLVRAGGTAICVKRALPRLRVAADWRVPVERNAAEAAWHREVATFLPRSVPAILAEDRALGIFAMSYLPEETHPSWKGLLARGEVDPETAALVGERLGAIHGRTARPELAASFDNDAVFQAIRLEPYLLATARRHPDRAAILERLAEATRATRRTLVHGDVSPKNILVGPQGPVFIDAECASFGDPAFDLAFCLNHLLLKCLWVAGAAGRLLVSFDRLERSYMARVEWEPADTLERRAAHLLPALMLARVDGKSPVEYLTEAARARVRRVARALLAAAPDRLAAVREAWAAEMARSEGEA